MVLDGVGNALHHWVGIEPLRLHASACCACACAHAFVCVCVYHPEAKGLQFAVQKKQGAPGGPTSPVLTKALVGCL